MNDDLRARMRAVFAGKLSDCGKGALQRYSVDSAKETLRYTEPSVTQDLSNQINAVTRARAFAANRARAFAANRDSKELKICVVCGAPDDLWHLDTPSGPILVHKECARFTRQGPTVEPSTAYEAISADPSGAICSVSIIELPRQARYRRTFAALQVRCPSLIPVERWRQCVQDGRRFLATWGEQAQALGWTSADLFSLHPPPDKPHPSYNRLSRYDATGLCWLLRGRCVVAITEATATIRNAETGAITVYRKHHKPSYGPLGD